MAQGTAHYYIRDFSIVGLHSRIELDRYYISDNEGWTGGNAAGGFFFAPLGTSSTAYEYIPKPFGSYAFNSAHWWHHYYSLIYTYPNDATTWNARAPGGLGVTFLACDADAGPCWAKPYSQELGARFRLHYTPESSGGPKFMLLDGRGHRYHYEDRWRADGGPSGLIYDRYFITRMEGPEYGRGSTSFTYSMPSISGGCPNGNLSGASAAIPYLDTMVSPEGATVRFFYKRIPARSGVASLLPTDGECVLDYIAVDDKLPDGGVTQRTLVQYGYELDGGAEQAGRLRSATWPHPTDSSQNRTEYYYYDDAGTKVFAVEAGGTPRVYQLVQSDNTVTRATGGGQDLSFTYPAVSEATGCQQTHSRKVIDFAASLGDGTSTTVPIERKYEYSTGGESEFYGQRVIAIVEDGGTSLGVSSGRIEYPVACQGSVAYDNPTYPRGLKDKRGNFFVWENVAGDAGTVPVNFNPLAERRTRYWGATAVSGTNALETETYSYVYGSENQTPRAFEQLYETDSRASVFADGGTDQNRRTRYVYDKQTNRLKAIIRSGWMHTESSGTWTNSRKYIGTFYFMNQPCSGGSADSLNRVREVHGPCWIDSETDTDCSSTGAIPVTQYDYYSSSTVGNNKNRLSKMRVFAGATKTSCPSGDSLETTYNEYDAQGNLLKMTDPNGVETTYTYERGFLKTKTTSSATTTYGYENGKNIWIQHPEGNYDVFCFRSGTSGGCTGGTWTDLLQWQAKSGTSTASSYSERTNFEYWPDQTLKKESFLASNGEVRRVRMYAADAHHRQTWTGWGRGDSSGPPPAAYQSTRKYDGADNVTGIGLPFNNPPSFCTTSGAHDKKCAQLESDRANRLSEVIEYPTTSHSGIRTCIGHDGHGNTTQVIAGLASSDPACLGSDGKINSSLPQTLAQNYLFDDFGNLAVVTLPWTGASGGGTTKYEYNALGLEIKKKSPGLSDNYIESQYDQLGRLTKKILPNSGSPITLYELQYDTGTPDNSCPQPTNAKGRLIRRIDSFGSTWYQYDSFGRVTKEARVRTGTSTCSSSNYANNPHTSYTYTSNGNLASVTYPHGRQVTFNYGTNGLKDRVASIDVSSFLADAGTSTLNVISAVAWEPYGGLRGYQINHPTTGTSAVEYMLGDSASTAPGSGSECPSSPPSTSGTDSDLSGRLRALRVSTGSFTPGTSNGNTYKRTYTWTGDQVVRTDTCVLNGAARTETYGYDQLLRLTSASGSGSVSGPFAARSYGYTARSNRDTLSEDSMSSTLTHASSALADRLTAVQSPDTQLKVSYAYDSDGRVTTRSSGLYDSGSAVHQLTFDYGPSANVATDTVFKSVSVNGASYNYYYDALGRRRAKVYPLGPKDEFYHDTSNQLLADQGNSAVDTPAHHTVDDYVWLDGRPVVLVRGKFNTTWSRQADSSSDCARNGESAACGFYFPVTDHIGKPVLMLDASAKVAGVGEYDPFGHLNRGVVYGGTSHPYPNSQSNQVIADVTYTAGTSTTVKMRMRLGVVELEAKLIQGDKVEIKDSANTVLESILATQTGEYVSGWHQKSQLKVMFTSDSTNCCSSYNCSACPGAGCCSCYPNCSYAGASVSSYEYQRYESTASWFWTPLRFPGQYYDPETDLFENWNRYYEPSIGRYLQPEPAQRKPLFIVAAAMFEGHSIPAYAYARNNPLFWVDPEGNAPCTTTYDCCIKGAMERGEDPKEKCNATEDDIRGMIKCHDDWGECAVKCGIQDPSCPEPEKNPFKAAKRAICMLGCNLALAKCLNDLFGYK